MGGPQEEMLFGKDHGFSPARREEYAEAAIADPTAGVAVTAPEGEEIRMEDVLGKGTRKRPSAATEDVDELQAETRRF